MNWFRLQKTLRYVYIPLIYIMLGVGAVYLALTPVFGYITTFTNLFFSNSAKLEETLTGAVVDGGNGRNEGSIDLADIHWPDYGEEYGKLECSRIGIDVPVYWGDSNQVLRSGAGTFIGSGLPGDQGTMLISAHNTTFFATLDQIQSGDIVTFTTTYGVYEYQITETKVLHKNDYSAFDLLQEREQLVLYTCYHIPGQGVTSYRLYVYGDRISGPDLVDGGAVQ